MISQTSQKFICGKNIDGYQTHKHIRVNSSLQHRRVNSGIQHHVTNDKIWWNLISCSRNRQQNIYNIIHINMTISEHICVSDA